MAHVSTARVLEGVNLKRSCIDECYEGKIIQTVSIRGPQGSTYTTRDLSTHHCLPSLDGRVDLERVCRGGSAKFRVGCRRASGLEASIQPAATYDDRHQPS